MMSVSRDSAEQQILPSGELGTIFGEFG